MTEFKIDVGIPMPPKPTAKRVMAYPWAKLAMGESFLFSDRIKPGDTSNANTLCRRHSVNGKEFDWGIRPEDNGLIRCWRVK